MFTAHHAITNRHQILILCGLNNNVRVICWLIFGILSAIIMELIAAPLCKRNFLIGYKIEYEALQIARLRMIVLKYASAKIGIQRSSINEMLSDLRCVAHKYKSIIDEMVEKER